jgi:hypothetical protein
MRTFMRVAVFISLTMMAIVGLHAQQPEQELPRPDITGIRQPTVLTKQELFSADHTADVVAVQMVWSAYTFYNDSHNGPGIASLFTPNAVIRFVWDNHDTLEPTFGIHPYMTAQGMAGGGCVLTGRKDFAQFYGYARDVNDQPLALPGPSHHEVVNEMVKVSDDGKTAMLTANHFEFRTADNGIASVGGTGSYRAFLEKTPDGWEINEMYGISDEPSTGDRGCDLHGPIPRPGATSPAPAVHAQQTKEEFPQPDLTGIRQPTVLTKHELFSEDHTADVVAVENAWSAYTYYNDSHNGPGIASLFTPDAVIRFVWNNHDTLEPHFGIHPYMTAEGMAGGGCVLRGREDFAQFYGYIRDIDNQPLSLPGPGHHVAVNKVVAVSADGKTAMMTASQLDGIYRAFYQKTPDGWEINEMYGISDHPSTGDKGCDMHGPIPRPGAPAVHAQQTKEEFPQPDLTGIRQPTVLTKHELFSEDHTADVVAIQMVLSAYAFYNDSHNGPGIASLFTPDAVIRFVWNNHTTLEPTFGIHPYMTAQGMAGGGCVLTGRKDFAQFYGYARDVNDQPLALPGPTHHEVINKEVKVDDEGKTAMLTANWIAIGVAANGIAREGGRGSYRVFLQKTPEGWEINEMYGISDQPSTGDKGCDPHGPIPRPKD